jgi:hypothetical protein
VIKSKFSAAAGAAAALGAAMMVPAVATANDTYAFETAQNGDFGVLDLDTGAFNKCGNSGLTLGGLGVGVTNPLYTAQYHSLSGITTIYTLAPSNGALTPVETDSISAVGVFGSTKPGSLYATDFTGELYSINPLNAVATMVGPTGVPMTVDVGMSTGSSTLYLTHKSTLYKIDTKTGHGKKIGAASDSITAMVMVGGVLYGATQANPPALVTLDTTTGASTPIATISGETTYAYGLAPAPKQKSGTCPATP